MTVSTCKPRLVLASCGLFLSTAAPPWGASHSVTVAPQPLPENSGAAGVVAANLAVAGSATLIPVMATATKSKPSDDIQFVKQATESGPKEVTSAQQALPQLENPKLKHIAEMLVTDHSAANAALSRIAEAKSWPVPAPSNAPQAPPSGTASSDFDAKWAADMIASHEHSVALYRAQAAGGEDKELRKYAHATLAVIENHLAQLRSLQK